MSKIKKIIVTAPEYEHAKALLRQLADTGLPSDAELIYHSRNSVALVCHGDKNYCVKAFRCPSLINAFVYTLFRHSKAFRSYNNSMRLLSMGFDAPTPVGYVEVRKGLRLRESYYVNEIVDGHNMREWEKRADVEELLDDFAAYMLRLHRAGVMHRDFSPGNFLVTKDENGHRHFNIIDVNRMEFNIGDKNKFMRNFRAINLAPAETERLARKYAKVAEIDEETCVKEALARLAAYERSKRRHRMLKRLIGKQKRGK